MKDFILSLYANENFPIYLGIFIVILVIAFLVVFFWGKKDQKLMETAKIKKISTENDAFKEIDTIEKLEVEAPKERIKDEPKKAPQNNNFEYTKTIELPKLDNKENTIKTVSIESLTKIADTIEEDLNELEKMQHKKVDTLFDDEETLELPKLK